MTPAQAAAGSGEDFRKKIHKSHRWQKYGWGIFLAAVMVLLLVFSAGFFLYSAVVVTILLLLSMAMASTSLLSIDIHRSLPGREITLGEAIDAWLVVHNQKALPAFWIFWKDHIDAGLDVEGVN